MVPLFPPSTLMNYNNFELIHLVNSFNLYILKGQEPFSVCIPGPAQGTQGPAPPRVPHHRQGAHEDLPATVGATDPDALLRNRGAICAADEPVGHQGGYALPHAKVRLRVDSSDLFLSNEYK